MKIKKRLEVLATRRRAGPGVTRIEIVDPETNEPFQIYERVRASGWTLTTNTERILQNE